ncbi:MAG: hypothetical protein ACTSVV_05690 [Promethearchaeota archaeon]
MENFQLENQIAFNKVLKAWDMGRPIKVSFDDIKDILVKNSEIESLLKIDETKINEGGIYSIYSEKMQYGMGKSQMAYFLQLKFENAHPSNKTEYHFFDPSEMGLNKLKERLYHCYEETSHEIRFYFFIDEIDLIDSPNRSEEEKFKLIEQLGNILIQFSDKAYHKTTPFYIFLVLSRRILEEINKYSSDRFKRRISPLFRVDLSFNKTDIEKFAITYFAGLWVSNYKRIQEKLIELDYRFKELMARLLTVIIQNLDFLKIPIESSSIGNFVERFREIFDIIFEGVDDDHLKKVNFNDDTSLGTALEKILKDYLIVKSQSNPLEENGTHINVSFNKNKKKIESYETDGYYEFKIGDNEIGIMPVEITKQQKIHYGRKKKQIKAFTNHAATLLICIYTDKTTVENELKKFDDEVKDNLFKILLPKDLIQYILLVKNRQFSLLEVFRNDIIGNIKAFLKKYGKTLYNRWMISRSVVLPLGKTPEKSEEDKKILLNTFETKILKFLENVFLFFEEASRRTHKSMKAKLLKELKTLKEPLEDTKIEWPFDDLNLIYQELTEILNDSNLCSYKTLDDNKFLMKSENFNIRDAKEKCKKVFLSRIQDKINSK